jgi:plastocyanin
MKTIPAKIFLVCLSLLAALTLAGCNIPVIKSLRDDVTATPVITPIQSNVIYISSYGFSPTDVSVTKGDVVVFTNTDKGPHQVASDPHPSHDALSDLYSTPIFTNQSYTYMFQKQGTWGVHLEDNPSMQATVIVN